MNVIIIRNLFCKLKFWIKLLNEMKFSCRFDSISYWRKLIYEKKISFDLLTLGITTFFYEPQTFSPKLFSHAAWSNEIFPFNSNCILDIDKKKFRSLRLRINFTSTSVGARPPWNSGLDTALIWNYMFNVLHVRKLSYTISH